MHPVEVVERDAVDAQPLEAPLELIAEAGRPTAWLVAALRRDHEPLRLGREGRSARRLALAIRIEVRRVDELDARLDRLCQEGAVGWGRGEAIGAEADAGELVIAEGEGAVHSPFLPARQGSTHSGPHFAFDRSGTAE